jgi:hypothetical protein
MFAKKNNKKPLAWVSKKNKQDTFNTFFVTISPYADDSKSRS